VAKHPNRPTHLSSSSFSFSAIRAPRSAFLSLPSSLPSELRVPRSALLLLGPTGSGKTPLGELLEKQGLRGRRCFHFDFGAALRAIDNGNLGVDTLTPADRRHIRHVLRKGLLLEDKAFGLAARILAGFIRTRKIEQDALLILNGLPRHIGQARRMAKHVRVRCVVHLDCSREVVWARIRFNTGGDRHGRADDARAAVDARYANFVKRTLPLLDYYRGKRARILERRIRANTTTHGLWRWLQKEWIPEWQYE
jgi:adenylate kinase